MKTHRIESSLTASFTALALGLAPIAAVHAQVPHYVQASGAPTSVQVVTPEAEAFALSKISGKPLRSASGEELGSVSDFLVDPKTGAVQFAVVPSGAGQSGETYRVVPIRAIDANNPEAFTVRLARSQWDQVGTLVEQRLQGQVSLDADFQQRLAQQFNLASPAETSATDLVRISQLKGQPVRSGNEQLGTIADVLVDVRHQTAAAVLTPPNATFGSAAQKFLVPFQQLQFGAGGQGGVTTSLTRNHFQPANHAMAPTGYSSAGGGAPFTQPHQQAFGSTGQVPVQSAAAAVQQAIARDQAAAGIQVVPESRIVLRGSVANQQKKIDLERAAVQAAAGVPIENQITVRSW